VVTGFGAALDPVASDTEFAAIPYGGEPLLNEPALRAAIEHIETLQSDGTLPADNLSIMVCTNGVLVDRRLARFFAAHGVSVAVGCDGPAEAHDAIRRDTDDKATYTPGGGRDPDPGLCWPIRRCRSGGVSWVIAPWRAPRCRGFWREAAARDGIARRCCGHRVAVSPGLSVVVRSVRGYAVESA